MRIGVILACPVVFILGGRFMWGQFFQPEIVVMEQTIFSVVDVNTARGVGARVATYCGECEEVPMGYECFEASMDYRLKFLGEEKNHPVGKTLLETTSTNDKWRFMSNVV
jgi:hypothetical protein